ncbi:hypothetical protein C8Q74DRAFT_1215209 [Fomes fomentarius]|nr:hypothetical protein C8Q74DRAFT_1215209 [Fomes fomentarius]
MAPVYGRFDHSASTSLLIVPAEATRVCIPRRIPEEFLSPTAVARTIVQCTWTGRPRDNPRQPHHSGARYHLDQTTSRDPPFLSRRRNYSRRDSIIINPATSLARYGFISAGRATGTTHTTPIDHDGTYGSIASGVAHAYQRFLEEAGDWEFDWEAAEDPLWDMRFFMYPSFDVFSLRLLSLVWVSQDVFQAEVDYVIRV